MPGQHERHARKKWEWGSPPARSAGLADAVTADTPRRPPSRKDRKNCCGGHPGRDHKPVITLAKAGHYWLKWGCGWRASWRTARPGGYGVAWGCAHEETCDTENGGCGRILRTSFQLGREECPAWPGTPGQLAAAEARAAAAQEKHEAWQARRVLRKKPPTGPDHYRRPKGGSGA